MSLLAYNLQIMSALIKTITCANSSILFLTDCDSYCKASKGKLKINMKKYCKKDYGKSLNFSLFGKAHIIIAHL